MNPLFKELNLTINIKENPYQIPLDSLFEVAARKNPKRSFLFVSKVLGKHLPVHPQIPKVIGLLLAHHYLLEIGEKSPLDGLLLADAIIDNRLIELALNHSNRFNIGQSKKTLIIGFAETATGLGHAMFSAFSDNTEFIHTTREEISDLKSAFNFEEEHSHATSHLCFPLTKNYFDQFERIVLVDDEITTGKTSLNLIRAFNQHFPNKEFVNVSILDWRNESQIEDFRKCEAELGIKISEVSILKGSIDCDNHPIVIEDTPLEEVKSDTEVDIFFHALQRNAVKCAIQQQYSLYDKRTGRFGLSCEDNKVGYSLDGYFNEKQTPIRKYKKTLCIGFGEYIYIPSQLASLLGNDVVYQSATRSPIYSLNEDYYPIKNMLSFKNPYNPTIQMYLYNIGVRQYDEVVIFLENNIAADKLSELVTALSRRGVKHISILMSI